MAWINNPGFCTPTIIVAILGLLIVISLIIALIFDPNRDNINRILIALVATIFWTIIIGGILFYLCAKGKIEASWWVLALAYLLPIAIGLFVAFFTAMT